MLTSNDIADLLVNIRTERGMELQEVADELGVPSTTYWNWERGKKTVHAIRLINALDRLGVELVKRKPACREGEPKVYDTG